MSKPKPYALLVACAALPVVCHQAAAQDALDREEVEALLKQRDAIIIDLQHRVNELRERLSMVERTLQAGAPMESLETAPGDVAVPPPPRETMPVPSQESPTRLVVDAAAAERALERTLVEAGALLLSKGTIEFVPALTYSVNETDFPVGTTAELGSSHLERRIFELDLTARFGLPFDSQLEIGVPYRSVTEDFELRIAESPVAASDRTGRGIGDVRIGFAKTLFRERGWRPDLIGRVTWGSGTGDTADDGVFVGGGFESIGGSLSFVQRRDPLALFLSLDYQRVRAEEGIKPGDQYGVSIGTALAVSPESSLFGSVTRRSIAETEVGPDKLEGTDSTVTTVNLGLSTLLRRGTLLNISSAIGVSESAPDYSLGFSMPIQRRPRSVRP